MLLAHKEMAAAANHARIRGFIQSALQVASPTPKQLVCKTPRRHRNADATASHILPRFQGSRSRAVTSHLGGVGMGWMRACPLIDRFPAGPMHRGELCWRCHRKFALLPAAILGALIPTHRTLAKLRCRAPLRIRC